MKMIPPGSTIGILGGGQLGRMTALAAARLGYHAMVYAPELESVAGQVTAGHFQGAYDDAAALAKFAQQVDVITYEFENVPEAAVTECAKHKPVRPGVKPIHYAQHRLREKAFFASVGLETAAYQAIRDEGLNRGQAMTYAASLVDEVGARLMGSPNMRRAHDWALARMRAESSFVSQTLVTSAIPAFSVLAEELKTSRQFEAIGGYAFLTQVSSRIPTTAQAGYFIEKVRELHLLRELIRSATGAVEDCYGFTGGIDEFVDRIEQNLFAVTQSRVSESAKPMGGPTNEAMKVITKMMMKQGELTGVTSGFKDLDALTFGFQRQEMIVLAARPSMGKTSLALNFAEAAALPKRGEAAPVLIFSLEMSAAQLALRMLCARASIPISPSPSPEGLALLAMPTPSSRKITSRNL